MSYLCDAISSLLSCCFPDPSIKINSRTFKILRLLGEGSLPLKLETDNSGFSYVYLVTDSAGSLYALKKIRCPFGQESVRNALKEVEAYNLFNHKSIIKCIDHATIQERDGTKTVYILLPYFRRGNLQDAINANLVNHTNFPELDLLKLFRGVCVALGQLHEHKLTSIPTTRPTMETEPLMDEEAAAAEEQELGEIVPYAHRDIKPGHTPPRQSITSRVDVIGNIMIADDGVTPVLMDFGSVVRARKYISTRQEALELQDLAAEQSTMPYRAPELFDVKTSSTIDEKVDIWSLGCTLFALLYGHSPFEPPTESTLVGDSIALAVTQGAFKFPEGVGGYVDWGAKEVVRKCLVVDPGLRPSVKEVRIFVEDIITRIETES